MDNEKIRLTKTRIAVLEILLASGPDRPTYGADIAYRADLETATVSLILKDLREWGWAEGWREESGEGWGARRHYHELTPAGYQGAIQALLFREERRRKQFKNYG